MNSSLTKFRRNLIVTPAGQCQIFHVVGPTMAFRHEVLSRDESLWQESVVDP